MANFADDPLEPEPELPNSGSSLDFLQAVYRCDGLPLSTRMRAAGMALPFEHPKLAMTALVDDKSFAMRLERAVLRSQMKVIEHQPSEAKVEGLKTDLTLRPMVPDRRFRRRA